MVSALDGITKRKRALEIVLQMIPDAEMLSSAPGEDRPPSFAADLVELGLEHAYHDLWTREGIDRRTRSIVTVSMMVAVRDWDELTIHCVAALHNGVTITELEEIVIHASGYVGFPAAANARRVIVAALTAAAFLP